MVPENTVRKYGNPPFQGAVIHGGPGAPGSMAPVARELSSERGILEPLQSAMSVDGQVEELKRQLEENAELPIILIGSSWGAWLSFIFAARYPEFVNKIILVGSGGFYENSGEKTHETRMNRLSETERDELLALMKGFDNSILPNKGKLLARLGELSSKTDTYNPLTLDSEEVIEFQPDVHTNVWREAAELRKTGELLEIGKSIRCSVVAIHGDCDPHPPEDVEGPLSAILSDFRFILLRNCGHEPWVEKEARDHFFEIVRQELDHLTLPG